LFEALAEFKNFVRILLGVPNFHRSELLVTFGGTKVTKKNYCRDFCGTFSKKVPM